MPATYEPIATTTLGSTTSSVTFSTIPGTYTDLILVTSTRVGSAIQQITMRLNEDTGNNYSYTEIYGNASSALSDKGSNVNRIYFGNTANSTSVSTVCIINIMNYTNSLRKAVLSRSNTPGIDVVAGIGLWNSTSVVTSITILTSGGTTFSTGSTFTLYGVKAA